MPGLFAILAPAKTLDMEADPPKGSVTTKPRLATRTKVLAEELRDYSPKKIASLMSISPKLADLNAERWSTFGSRANPRGAAALCFKGDVYMGLEAWTMKAAALKWAQAHIRIISGLYGILRPLDVIQPYRLEMGTKLKTDVGSNLYEFWGNDIVKLLQKDMKDSGASTLINLASDEYSKAVHLDTIDMPVINVKFLQVDKGKPRFFSFFAKRARGLMARWMADNKPKTLKDLANFDTEGYRLAKSDSDETTLVFTRPRPAAKAAG